MNPVKINTLLYGGKPILGGREKPLVADETFCTAQHCQFRDVATCLHVRPRLCKCPYGTTIQTKGYTSRAKKYGEFKQRYEADATYHALSHPSNNIHFRIINEHTYLYMPGVAINYAFNINLNTTPILARTDESNAAIIISKPTPAVPALPFWAAIDDITADAIIKICEVARSIDAHSAYEAQQANQRANMLIDDIRRAHPALYRDIIAQRPDYADLKVDYIGRRAIAVTLKQNAKVKDFSGNVFTLEGRNFVCHDYADSLAGPRGITAKGATLSIPITNEDTVVISDNDSVDADNTIFV